MNTNEFADKVSLADLISLLNDLQNPYDSWFPYIQNNTDDNVDEMAVRQGGVWLLESAQNPHGRFRSSDKYILCDINADYIFTFSTKEELVEHIGRGYLVETLDEYYGDGTGIVERYMDKYEAPCEIVGFEL